MRTCPCRTNALADSANNSPATPSRLAINNCARCSDTWTSDAIVTWWRTQGRRRYPAAHRLLILADGGGSNGYRNGRWKTQLQQRLVNAFALTVTVCHYPPGAAKWNPVEHRLFSQISQTWAGLPLTSVEVSS